jgi:hypothetical protein
LAAKSILGNRVGIAWRELRNHLEALGEQEQEIVERHTVKVNGKPVAVHDDAGKPIGVELDDMALYNAERKPLMKNMVTIPDLKPISYELLEKAGVVAHGELVVQLGAFLTGEPQETVDAQY